MVDSHRNSECHMPMLWRSSDGRELKCVQSLDKHDSLFGQSETSRVGRRCHMREGGRYGSWILEVLMWWIHSDMNFLDWPQMDMVW